MSHYQVITGVKGDSHAGSLSGTTLLCGDERWRDLRRGIVAAALRADLAKLLARMQHDCHRTDIAHSCHSLPVSTLGKLGSSNS